MESIWTSKEIIAAIIATGLVSAAASWCVDLIKTQYEKKKAARYGALRCAAELERYAIDCWRVFSMGKGEFLRSGGVGSTSLPDAPAFPIDVDWKALSSPIANDILSFSNVTKVSEAQAKYADVFEQNPYDLHAAAKERGLEALKLAGRIRIAYDLKSPDGFNPVWKEMTD